MKAALASFFSILANIYWFTIQFFKEVFTARFESREFVKQCHQIGVGSLALIGLTGFITGFVFTNQSRPSLANFGATSWLPSLVSIAVVRALSSLVTALIISGKVGSQIGAELGSMRVTEQIEAMEVSASNPFNFLVVTRVFATTLMMPVLSLYTALMGLLGGYLNIHQNELISFASFMDKSFNAINMTDLAALIFRALVFGFTIGIISCYQGYHASKGTESVGIAANRSVVISMFLIFLEELLIVHVFKMFR